MTSASLAGRRILIVEDELLVAMDLEDVLNREGCEVLEPAATIDEALGAIARYQPEAAVLDLNLDGASTVDIAEELVRRSIPFVVVSGFVKGNVSEPVLKVAPFVQKPWSRGELLRQLEDVLR